MPVWLADNRIPYDGIYYGPDKLDVRASVLVDDRPDAIQAGVAAGLRVFKPAHEYCQWGGAAPCSATGRTSRACWGCCDG